MADGVIKSIRYARERADFNGMKFGSITPTDIDGFVEFGNQVFVFIETKHGDAEMPLGQRLALERVCDRVQKSGAESMVLILQKSQMSYGPTYRIAQLPVTQYRYKGAWYKPRSTLTAFDAVEKFKSKFLASAPAVVVDPRLQNKDEWVREYDRALSET